MDYKIEKKSDTKFEVTQLPNGKAITVDVNDFNLDYGSLLRFNQNGQDALL